jgi:hypothetical protein
MLSSFAEDLGGVQLIGYENPSAAKKPALGFRGEFVR